MRGKIRRLKTTLAKLEVLKRTDVSIEYHGSIYEKVEHPIMKGDIVQCFEDGVDLTEGAFYEVNSTDTDNDFQFLDDVSDERDRSCNDDEFVPYRKVEGVVSALVAVPGPQGTTVTINQPVHLVLTNVKSIEVKELTAVA
jgi:hypothetical protein